MPVFQSHIGMVVAARQCGFGVRIAGNARPTGQGSIVTVNWSSLIIRPLPFIFSDGFWPLALSLLAGLYNGERAMVARMLIRPEGL